MTELITVTKTNTIEYIVLYRWFSMRLDCFIFIFIATILFSSISLAESNVYASFK